MQSAIPVRQLSSTAVIDQWLDPALRWLNANHVFFLDETEHRNFEAYALNKKYIKPPEHYQLIHRVLVDFFSKEKLEWRLYLITLIIAADVLMHLIVNESLLKEHLHHLLRRNQAGLLKELSRSLQKKKRAGERYSAADEQYSAKGKQFCLRYFGTVELNTINFSGFEEYKELAIGAYGHVLEILEIVLNRLSRLSLDPHLQKSFRTYFGDPFTKLDETRAESDISGEEAVRRVMRTYSLVQDSMTRNCPIIALHGSKCKDGADGYVNHSGSRKFGDALTVHLCLRLFTQPDMDIAGIMLHEFTHSAAWTKDHAYRADACVNLLQKENGQILAVNNADSYRHYAEMYKHYVQGWR
ncbi:MAG TPA: M35 family metallo-endopeptidase [Pseudacidobacterium sp.]|jgi:hypothetical protein|nr:M35 family metallo-endopeptidase [Pseudacidobacterium sp.]